MAEDGDEKNECDMSARAELAVILASRKETINRPGTSKERRGRSHH